MRSTSAKTWGVTRETREAHRHAFNHLVETDLVGRGGEGATTKGLVVARDRVRESQHDVCVTRVHLARE